MKLVEHYIMRGTRRLVLIIVGFRRRNVAEEITCYAINLFTIFSNGVNAS